MNKCVLSLDLNSGRVEEFLRSDGRAFQTEGARKLTVQLVSISERLKRIGLYFKHNI